MEMMKMNARKATLVLGALLITGAMLASAQSADTAAPAEQTTQPSGRHRGMNPDKQAERLGKRLNLSQDQVAQIKPILADRAQQMEALRSDTSLAPEDRRAKARSIMEDSNSKIEAVLNDQQKQQYEEMLASRRSHHRRGGQMQPQDQPQPNF